MALVVQDDLGTKSDAESYIDVAYLDAYHNGLGNTTLTAKSEADKEILCRKATKTYMEVVYYGLWKGERLTDTQNTEYPRVIDGESVGVPDRVKQACAELAGIADTTKLLPDIEQRIVKEKVAVIETTYSEYDDQLTQYTTVYNLIKEYLANSSLNSVSMTRS